MNIDEKIINDLIYSNTNKSLPNFLNRLDFLITNEIGVKRINVDSGDFVDKDFLRELKHFCQNAVSLHFGKSLRDLKCVISDENFRKHMTWIQYLGPKNLHIKDMDLPRAHIQEQVYRSIDEVVNVLKKHLHELCSYFDELDRIDQECIVMEPVRPTYKDDYRKIQLADKIWLHVEVSPDGAAKNLRVLGQFDQRELQELLQDWDHDKDIATNVRHIASSMNCDYRPETNQAVAVPDCGICYCVKLPGDTRVPEPLCNNSKCGVYFHRSCLYEWLVTCKRGRTPQFGDGECPSCSQYIQCTDRDIRQ